MSLTAFTQPSPGDVYREYVWLPTMTVERGRFLRVGGRLDYKSSPDHFSANRHENGYILFGNYVELDKAIKAEVVLEKIGAHEDTRGLRISLNRNPAIKVPAAKGIPEPESDYMQHTYPTINIPLDQLKEGVNIIKTGKEPLHNGAMVHGMEVQWPGIMFLIKYQ